MTAALLELCRAAVHAARDAGAEEAEACAEHVDATSARAEQNDLAGAETSHETMLGLRVLVRGAAGFAAVNRVDPGALAEAAARAVALARAGAPEEGLVLPLGGVPPVVVGLFDASTAARRVTDVVEDCAAMLSAARGRDPRIRVDGASAACQVVGRALASTRGVAAASEESVASVSIMGMAVDGEDVTGLDHEVDAAIIAARLDPAAVGRRLADRVLGFLGARAWDGPETPRVVLGPDAVMEMLLDPLLASMDGEAIRLGTSRLQGHLGQPVAHAAVTLVDDPLAAGEVGSAPFDREGTPHVVTTLVGAGVLMANLHNATSAFRSRAALTGHAAGGASAMPGIGISRLVMAPGDASTEELVHAAGEGVYVGRFSGAVDEVGGDFSGVAKCSFRIRAGRLAEPLRETTVSGNAWDVLKRVLGVGREQKRMPGQWVPPLLVDGVTVAGGG